MYLIKKKSDAFLIFKDFKARVELESRKRIKCLRTDSGGEYIDGDLLHFVSKRVFKTNSQLVYTSAKWCSRVDE